MVPKPYTELKITSVPDGIFVPAGTISKYDLVYDENLKLVTESTLRRGVGGSKDISCAPKYLDKKLLRWSKTVPFSMVFLGHYDASHYGHWLTEGLSRFWYFLEHPVEGSKVPEGTNVRKILIRLRDRVAKSQFHWRSAFRAFGICSHNLERWPAAFRANEIRVPEPSMVNASHLHRDHLKVTQQIARFVIRGKSFVRDERPLYLSRTKLKRSVHSFRGEHRIEEYCRKSGFRIVYPERLSLRDQIEMVNIHDTFVGLQGSAFHSLMFRLPGRSARCVYLSTERGEGGNYANIDALMETETKSISCCDRDETSIQNKVIRCNPDLAIRELSKYFSI